MKNEVKGYMATEQQAIQALGELSNAASNMQLTWVQHLRMKQCAEILEKAIRRPVLKTNDSLPQLESEPFQFEASGTTRLANQQEQEEGMRLEKE